MAYGDRVEVHEDFDNKELSITVDTNGMGRAMADALIDHVDAMIEDDHERS